MKPRQIDLQIKIASLAYEARLIRHKEQNLKHEAFKLRNKAIATHKQIKIGPMVEMPPDLLEICTKRAKPQQERLARQENWEKADTALYTTARKAIRKWLRSGLTKEEILAMPGVQKSLQYSAKVDNLYRHRKYIVRHEARHSQLAYAFLRGKTYKATEDKANSYPNWDKIQELAQRFSEEDKRIVAQKFEQWRQEAYDMLYTRERLKLKGLTGAVPFRLEPKNVT